MNRESDNQGEWLNPNFTDTPGAARVAGAQLLGRELRAKVRAGFALGTFVIELPTPATLSTLAIAGFDFVVLDMEHSTVGFSQLGELITAGQNAGLAVLVRPWGEDAGMVGKILDIGANGVMVPRVESDARARAIVEQARFAPIGNRGFSPVSRYDALRTPLADLNDSTFLVLQIEGRAGIDNAAAIAAVPGIDCIFVGPYDLALSLGLEPGSPAVHDAAAKLADLVPQDMSLGIFVDDPADCGKWAGRRFALQCVSFDGRMLACGARAVTGPARAAVKRKDAQD
jgi:2-keto-3-deoxy-L-rhamnonate aldolase RhmA